MKNAIDHTNRLISVLQFGLFLVFVVMTALFGSEAFFELRATEFIAFHSAFDLASYLITIGVTEKIQKKMDAGILTAQILNRDLDHGGSSFKPNITLHDFEGIMSVLSKSSGVRYIAFSPLVTDLTRHSWENYAATNVNVLNGPSSLSKSINGSWTVADGISTISSSNNKVHQPFDASSTLLFPVWQVAPLIPNIDLVMSNSYENGNPTSTYTETMNRALNGETAAFTDFLFLIPDGNLTTRPSTIIFKSITSENATVGLLSAGFSWDDMLIGIWPVEELEIVCVIKSNSSKSMRITLSFYQLITYLLSYLLWPISRRHTK